jgi:ubiquinone/menaquinone biosynthesis C-methylase UbiE
MTSEDDPGGAKAPDHVEVVRESFRHQTEAFSGPDSVYARRDGPLAWIEPLDASMTVLDVACGAAHASESVAPFVRQVVGVDITRELLDVGRNRLSTGAVGNVLLQESNAEALPFVDASFDVAFCRSSLHHFENPGAALSEMERVTRPGGRIVIVDLIAPDGSNLKRFDQLHRMLDPSHVHSFTQDELLEAVASYSSITYVKNVRMRFPIDVAINELSDRESVMSALYDEMAGGAPTGFEPSEKDGSVVVTFLTCVVHAAVRG